MNSPLLKFSARLAACALVPCLLMDPATAMGIAAGPSRESPGHSSSALLTLNALSLHALAEKQAPHRGLQTLGRQWREFQEAPSARLRFSFGHGLIAFLLGLAAWAPAPAQTINDHPVTPGLVEQAEEDRLESIVMGLSPDYPHSTLFDDNEHLHPRETLIRMGSKAITALTRGLYFVDISPGYGGRKAAAEILVQIGKGKDKAFGLVGLGRWNDAAAMGIPGIQALASYIDYPYGVRAGTPEDMQQASDALEAAVRAHGDAGVIALHDYYVTPHGWSDHPGYERVGAVLVRVGGPTVLRLLTEDVGSSDRNSSRAWLGTQLIGQLGSPQTVFVLIRKIKDEPSEAWSSVEALVQMGEPAIQPVLDELLKPGAVPRPEDEGSLDREMRTPDEERAWQARYDAAYARYRADDDRREPLREVLKKIGARAIGPLRDGLRRAYRFAPFVKPATDDVAGVLDSIDSEAENAWEWETIRTEAVNLLMAGVALVLTVWGLARIARRFHALDHAELFFQRLGIVFSPFVMPQFRRRVTRFDQGIAGAITAGLAIAGLVALAPHGRAILIALNVASAMIAFTGPFAIVFIVAGLFGFVSIGMLFHQIYAFLVAVLTLKWHRLPPAFPDSFRRALAGPISQAA